MRSISSRTRRSDVSRTTLRRFSRTTRSDASATAAGTASRTRRSDVSVTALGTASRIEPLRSLHDDTGYRVANHSLRRLRNHGGHRIANEALRGCRHDRRNGIAQRAFRSFGDDRVNRVANRALGSLGRNRVNGIANRALRGLGRNGVNRVANRALGEPRSRPCERCRERCARRCRRPRAAPRPGSVSRTPLRRRQERHRAERAPRFRPRPNERRREPCARRLQPRPCGQCRGQCVLRFRRPRLARCRGTRRSDVSATMPRTDSRIAETTACLQCLAKGPGRQPIGHSSSDLIEHLVGDFRRDELDLGRRWGLLAFAALGCEQRLKRFGNLRYWGDWRDLTPEGPAEWRWAVPGLWRRRSARRRGCPSRSPAVPVRAPSGARLVVFREPLVVDFEDGSRGRRILGSPELRERAGLLRTPGARLERRREPCFRRRRTSRRRLRRRDCRVAPLAGDGARPGDRGSAAPVGLPERAATGLRGWLRGRRALPDNC